LALSSCAASRELAVGDYQETRGPDVMMWTIAHFSILPGHAFQYGISTDDESGRFGAGSYTLRGKRLQLLFNGKALVPPSYAQLQRLPTRPDSLLLTFDVHDAANGNEPLFLVGVTLCDEAGGVVSGEDGRAVVRIARSHHTHPISIKYVGRQTLEMPWPDSSTAYQIYLHPSLGTLYPAGSTLQFRVLEQTPAQLVVRRGKSKATFRFTP
jgi:hypothetical protein